VALVAEQLGRGLADTKFLGPTLAAELRRLAGAPAGAALETVAFAPDLSDVGCVAEPNAPKSVREATQAVVPRTDLPHTDVPQTDVPQTGVMAVDATGSPSALVLCPNPQGHHLATVRLTSVDADTATADQVDLTRTVVRVGQTAPDRVEGQRHPLGESDLQRWTALGLAITSADLVGVMTGAVRLARDYAAERRQYGVAVGSFQALQHLLADAHVATEGSRSATLHAAWAVDALPPADALAAAAVAKAYSSRAARTVCETAIQVHGGIGNTWECLAHVFLRRALLSADVLGGAGTSLARVLAHHRLVRSNEPTGAGRGVR
jgi:hypothetical protein